MSCLGHVDKNPAALLLELKRFGMAEEFNAAGQHTRHRIDDAERAVAVADINAVQLCVITQVVGVVERADGHQGFE